MTQNLFYSELLFSIISSIAAMVVWELIRSKDGMLRKIMIAYFLIEILVYGGSGVYFWALEKGYTDMTISTFRMIVILPKTSVMLWLYFYLRTKQ